MAFDSDWGVEDIEVPAAPGSLMRAVMLWRPGKFRISRRDSELYSVQIASAGAWAHLTIYTGEGRKVFKQMSTFTGSFWLSAGCEGGIIAFLEAATTAPTVTLNFRERDRQLV